MRGNLAYVDCQQSSLSARRAWIEIFLLFYRFLALCVALRKESVDRNIIAIDVPPPYVCRSPQGERG